MQFVLVVDVSTNYPNPPMPRIDNAREPIAIKASVGRGLTPDGGSAFINATLHDWQGVHTIGGVKVEAPASLITLVWGDPGINPDEYVYTGTITNEKLAPLGEYSFLVSAWAHGTGIHIYDEFKAEVQEAKATGNLLWVKHAGWGRD